MYVSIWKELNKSCFLNLFTSWTNLSIKTFSTYFLTIYYTYRSDLVFVLVVTAHQITGSAIIERCIAQLNDKKKNPMELLGRTTTGVDQNVQLWMCVKTSMFPFLFPKVSLSLIWSWSFRLVLPQYFRI